jgi:hypothetical protein
LGPWHGVENRLKFAVDRNFERRTGFMPAYFDRTISHVLVTHVNNIAVPLTGTQHEFHRQPRWRFDGMLGSERVNIFLSPRAPVPAVFIF